MCSECIWLLSAAWTSGECCAWLVRVCVAACAFLLEAVPAMQGAKSTKSEGIFVGGQCVQSSEADSHKSSAGLHSLYVLLLLVTGALMGVGGLFAWQTGAVTMLLDRIPWLSSRRSNANNLLYSELSMDTNNTGF